VIFFILSVCRLCAFVSSLMSSSFFNINFFDNTHVGIPSLKGENKRNLRLIIKQQTDGIDDH
jgi:hypothetical protein